MFQDGVSFQPGPAPTNSNLNNIYTQMCLAYEHRFVDLETEWCLYVS